MNSPLRTGSVTKKSVMLTVVPTFLAHIAFLAIAPSWSNKSLVPCSEVFTLVVTLTFDSAHSELNASPRKPKDLIDSKSEKSFNFDVWCFAVMPAKFSSEIPIPGRNDLRKNDCFWGLITHRCPKLQIRQRHNSWSWFLRLLLSHQLNFPQALWQHL